MSEQSNIPGRTPLSDVQKDLIRELDRAHAEQMAGFEQLRMRADVDQRAIALAITNAQQAHMWAVRAVAKPTF